MSYESKETSDGKTDHTDLLHPVMSIRGLIYEPTADDRSSRETLLVDNEENMSPYIDFFREVEKRAVDDEGKVQRQRVLRAIFDTVHEKMPSSEEAIGQFRHENGGYNGKVMGLSQFMEAGVGTWLHQTLACGVLIEYYKDDGHLDGYLESKIATDGGSDIHGWMRFTDVSGEVYILDVAKNYFGTLEDSIQDAAWDYLSLEDKQARAAKMMGRTGLRGIIDRFRGRSKTS